MQCVPPSKQASSRPQSPGNLAFRNPMLGRHWRRGPAEEGQGPLERLGTGRQRAARGLAVRNAGPSTGHQWADRRLPQLANRERVQPACVGSHEPDRGDERLAIDRGLAIDLDRDAAAAPQPPVRSAEELSQGDRDQTGSEERHLADGAGAADTQHGSSCGLWNTHSTKARLLLGTSPGPLTPLAGHRLESHAGESVVTRRDAGYTHGPESSG
jgi:hypothetical protein